MITNLNPKRLVVFISGNGSNLKAILDAIAKGTLNAQVVLVVSNRISAYGLKRAENAGVPTIYFPFKPYREAGKPREAYDADLAERIAAYQPDLIVLAGWMHVLSPAFINHYPGKIINLHPALPNTFPGTDAIERAFEAHQRGEINQSGCMMHHVVPEVDAGPVISQTIVPFSADDTLEAYETRMHAAEHLLIVQAIRTTLG
jgi:formyltetrahydrofolate-dependent phosphoribosylglycinamide formyltransferase